MTSSNQPSSGTHPVGSSAFEKGSSSAGSKPAADGSSFAGISSKASDTISDAADSVSRMAAGFTETLRDGVETQKNAGADAVSGLAQSAREAARGLDSTSPQAARLVRSSADAVESVSKNLRDHSVGELMESVGDFAGRQPAAFFGCGVLAGLIFARLISNTNR